MTQTSWASLPVEEPTSTVMLLRSPSEKRRRLGLSRQSGDLVATNCLPVCGGPAKDHPVPAVARAGNRFMLAPYIGVLHGFATRVSGSGSLEGRDRTSRPVPFREMTGRDAMAALGFLGRSMIARMPKPVG